MTVKGKTDPNGYPFQEVNRSLSVRYPFERLKKSFQSVRQAVRTICVLSVRTVLTSVRTVLVSVRTVIASVRQLESPLIATSVRTVLVSVRTVIASVRQLESPFEELQKPFERFQHPFSTYPFERRNNCSRYQIFLNIMY